MTASVSSSTTATTPQSGGARGSNEKSSSLDSQLAAKNAGDRASISEAAKSLSQPRETMNVSLDQEQARQLVLDINAIFSQDASQALASQSANIDERVRELLQQTA